MPRVPRTRLISKTSAGVSGLRDAIILLYCNIVYATLDRLVGKASRGAGWVEMHAETEGVKVLPVLPQPQFA